LCLWVKIKGAIAPLLTLPYVAPPLSRSADSITRLLIKMQPISKKLWRGMLDESINYKRP